MIRIILDRSTVPLVPSELLERLQLSQEDFLRWVVYELPAIDQDDPNNCLSDYVAEMYQTLVGFGPDRHWGELFLDNIRKVAFVLLPMTAPIIEAIPCNSIVDFVELDDSTYPTAYVINMHLGCRE